MGKRFEFSLRGEVLDEEVLFKAALEHALAAGCDEATARLFLQPEGKIDAEACATQLLDPSTLPGCVIEDSDASTLTDFEEEAPSPASF